MPVLTVRLGCRSAAGVLASDPKSRDIKIEQYTLSYHGRLLIDSAEISLNYGNRYGLLGENGSGKVRFTARHLWFIVHADPTRFTVDVPQIHRRT
jgi:ABC-type lipopolysaccharide export system ATPase subunit